MQVWTALVPRTFADPGAGVATTLLPPPHSVSWGNGAPKPCCSLLLPGGVAAAHLRFEFRPITLFPPQELRQRHAHMSSSRLSYSKTAALLPIVSPQARFRVAS